jgi:hypothetical protein
LLSLKVLKRFLWRDEGSFIVDLCQFEMNGPEEQLFHFWVRLVLLPYNRLFLVPGENLPTVGHPGFDLYHAVLWTNHASLAAEGDANMAFLAVQKLGMIGMKMEEGVEDAPRCKAEANLEGGKTRSGWLRIDEVDVGICPDVRNSLRVGSLATLHVTVSR